MGAQRKVSSTGCYHVILRGNGKQLLFEDDADRRFFLDCLQDALKDGEVEVIAWCLMDNHVHLCLRGDADALGEDVSKLMHVVCLRFAKRFNWKADHVGHVFQSRFERLPIETEAYLLETVRYIHANPAKAGLCSAGEWPWSSYQEYMGARPGPARICNTAPVLESLGGVEGFEEFSRQAPSSGLQFEGRRRIPDSDARQVAMEVLGGQDPMKLRELPQHLRNEALGRLRAHGLSVRQIGRITGIGTATITRATSGK